MFGFFRKNRKLTPEEIKHKVKEEINSAKEKYNEGKNGRYVKSDFDNLKIGDMVIYKGKKYEMQDIIKYEGNIFNFIKYELVGDKGSSWLMLKEEQLYFYEYMPDYIEEKGDNIIYGDKKYSMYGNDMIYKESIRKYDDSFIGGMDKSVKTYFYKSLEDNEILLEETSNINDMSKGVKINKDDLLIETYIYENDGD